MDTLPPHGQDGNASSQKRCTGPCGRLLFATAEFFHRRGGGLRAECKECRNHKGEIYQKQAEVRQRKRINDRRYYALPAARAKLRVRTRAYEIRQKGILGVHTLEQIQKQLKRQRHCCYYCSLKFQKSKGGYVYHVEHTFPLSRVVGTDIPANDISYLVLACPTCNIKKGDKFPWEFPEGGRLL